MLISIALLLQLSLPIYKHLNEILPGLNWFAIFAVLCSRVVIMLNNFQNDCRTACNMVLLLIKSAQCHGPIFAQPRGGATGVKSRKNRVVSHVAKRKGNKHLLDMFLF